jgi:signal transduction histidine kinase
LRQTIVEVQSLLAPQASAKGLAIALEYAAGAPVNLMGDALRMRQVLVNLIGNAIKFTEHGGVAVSVECAEKTDDAASLVLRVRDTGIGIPADKLDLVFDKFTQADGSMTRRYGGTGLGLTIVKQLVEAMGGSIVVESRIGEGTTFTITLPLRPVAAPDPDATGNLSAERFAGKGADLC